MTSPQLEPWDTPDPEASPETKKSTQIQFLSSKHLISPMLISIKVPFKHQLLNLLHLRQYSIANISPKLINIFTSISFPRWIYPKKKKKFSKMKIFAQIFTVLQFHHQGKTGLGSIGNGPMSTTFSYLAQSSSCWAVLLNEPGNWDSKKSFAL